MSDITKFLEDAANGVPTAAEKLMPLIYDELRKLAAARLASEKPGHTLQATSLVHEAYLRLVERQPDVQWEGRGHFFSAAAEAMRRILIDRARRKLSVKRGGDRDRKVLAEDSIVAPDIDSDCNLMKLNAAMTKLEQKDARKAELVKLRYFVGLSLKDAADVLGVSVSTADREWAYARAWLYRQISEGVD